MVRGFLARLWPFSAADPEDDSADLDAPDEDGDQVRTWDFVPSWQYDGWRVQNGGHAVAEQERALAQIQAQAKAIEAAEATDGEADDEHPE